MRARSDQATGLQELARNANVPIDFVERLAELGAIDEEPGRALGQLGRIRLLHAWSRAGLPVETIMRLVHDGRLSITFLDTPAVEGPPRLERSYREVAGEHDSDEALIDDLHQAIGFEPPRPDDRAGRDDVALLEVIDRFEGVGVPPEPVLRLFAVYAESLRRATKAEAEFYESTIEGRLRDRGLSERELIEFGTTFGARTSASIEQALVMVYRRHRVHTWIEHAVNHVESALEDAGVEEFVPQPPAICFVDLTGYTRLTEERGDRFAADVAGRLAQLVKEVSRRRGGTPIRWLGDGGMFHFREPSRAVEAAMDMSEATPERGLPPAHIGIHAGPVIFQDGDVYGRTVNIASRLASVAQAGEVVVSEEVARRTESAAFEDIGPVPLKGVAAPMRLFRIVL